MLYLSCVRPRDVSDYLRGLLQVQPGLGDDPLGVLQLRLELAVFSGHLLKQLTHTHTHTRK